MKKFLLIMLLTLYSCVTWEDKPYTKPTKIQNILFLPFQEENSEKKNFLEKKGSSNFYLGFGIAHNLHQLANQTPEIFSVPLEEVTREISIESQFKPEQELLDLFKSQQIANFLVVGNFEVIEKNKLKVVAKVYNLETLEVQKIKSKTVVFGEKAKENEETEYSQFIKNGLYSSILKFVLCYRVKQEICESLQKENLNTLYLEETQDFSEFLLHSQGLYHFYESVQVSDNYQNVKEKNFSKLYLGKAIAQSKSKGQIYKNAIQSFVSLEKADSQEAEEINLKLSRFQISYNPNKDVLEPILEKEDSSNLRNVINQAKRFILEHPEYRLYVTSAWSNEFDNSELRGKNFRSTNFIEFLYGKQNGNSENSPYIFQDILENEDTTTITLRITRGNL